MRSRSPRLGLTCSGVTDGGRDVATPPEFPTKTTVPDPRSGLTPDAAPVIVDAVLVSGDTGGLRHEDGAGPVVTDQPIRIDHDMAGRFTS